jgi:NAD(P)-dependent dehydrogenase (short-subunit alcohol dehydrogenase family)
MEALQPEVEPFGINTTIVNPGFFRTDLLTPDSATYATSSIPDYADRHAERMQWYQDMNGHQEGGPGQARPGPAHHRRPAATAAPVHRPGSHPRGRRAEGPDPAGPGRRLP